MKGLNERTLRAGGLTRRGFLSSVAAGAAGAALIPLDCSAQLLKGQQVATRSDRFSRMFDLPSFAEPTAADPGRAHGARRARRADGRQGPAARRPDPPHHEPGTEPAQSRQHGGDCGRHVPRPVSRPRYDVRRDVEAGTCPRSPSSAPNTRTPAFDLDSVYGGGFVVEPAALRSRATAPSSRWSTEVCSKTCPAAPTARAIIADPRNDENLMISGLQVAFLLFHNRVVDKLRDDGEDRLAAADLAGGGSTLPEREEDDRRRAVFAKARRLVTWHYHWIIVNEFLPADHRRVARAATSSRADHASILRAPGRAEHSGGVPGRRLSLRTQHGAAVVPRESRRRRRRVRSLASSSIRPARARPTLSICEAAPGRPDASSAGRRSSTLAVISRRTCGRRR